VRNASENFTSSFRVKTSDKMLAGRLSAVWETRVCRSGCQVKDSDRHEVSRLWSGGVMNGTYESNDRGVE